VLRKAVLAATIATTVAAVPTIASAGAPGLPLPATEGTQLTNMFQLQFSYAAQYESMLREIQTALNTTQQVAQGVTNLTKLPDDVWAKVQFNLAQLQQLATNVQGLNFANGNTFAAFRAQYPQLRTTTDFYKEYATLHEGTQLRVKQALDAADASLADVRTIDQTLETLRRASQTAVGQMQAIQAGNAISLQLAEQLTRMRILMNQQLEVQEAHLRLVQDQEGLRARARAGFYSLDPQHTEQPATYRSRPNPYKPKP
jgi:type IV secretion system protein TrbJ